MTAVSRQRRAVHVDGVVAEPSALASVPVLADGQIAPVTDQGGRNLYVKKGGGYEPAVDVPVEAETNGPIKMEIDYSTGLSPAAGTVVHNQDEYDALTLGSSGKLKYPQDALDILPPLIRRYVEIHLGSGNHYAKPGNLDAGYSCWIALMGGAAPLVKHIYDASWALGFLFDYAYEGAITFYGPNDTELEAAQAGTSTTYDITRSAGTWTANQHQGKFVLITSGPAAGTKRAIAWNDTTKLYFGYPLSSTGSIQFEIVEPAAKWLNDDNAGGIIIDESQYLKGLRQINFVNIQLGTVSAPVEVHVKDGLLQFVDCIIEAGNSSPLWHNSNPSPEGAAYLIRCVLHGVSSSGVLYLFGGQYSVFGSVVHSACIGSLIDMRAGSFLQLAGTYLVNTNASYTDQLLRINGGICDASGGATTPNRIKGAGSEDGVYIDGVAFTQGQFIIDDCGVAVHAVCDCEFGTVSGSNNTTGWKLGDGAKVQCSNPQNVSATNGIDIDGVVHPYSDLPANSWIEGQYGSKIVRR